MNLELFADSLRDYARDIKLNLGTVLTPEGAPGLSRSQILGVALASSYATRLAVLVQAVDETAGGALTDAHREAAKAAATIMAMNNVYYRSQHLAGDAELSQLPARLRMNVIGKPGIEKVDFELYCLAVSALAGCGKCITSHMAEVKKAGISSEGVQSAIRIASVINAAAQAHFIG